MIQNEVSEHYEDLLTQCTGIEKLEDVISMMQAQIMVIENAIYNNIKTFLKILSTHRDFYRLWTVSKQK